ncbi:hypothetical protein [Actinacidiphila sp. ITFR-21]|uniref:hypothetical protein n=1 Tax=Actinacidiphila sp. ITFR-21 TaxID=3075199 RepID=UPI002889EFA0|nr:hypothetical protein [Streptomyces sp. ITFR-21]WNI14475.1 hypothetical protein RLT57_02230 [Streptomyces sp. ITFR-21]
MRPRDQLLERTDQLGAGRRLPEPRSLIGPSEKITQRAPGWPATSRANAARSLLRP